MGLAQFLPSLYYSKVIHKHFTFLLIVQHTPKGYLNDDDIEKPVSMVIDYIPLEEKNIFTYYFNGVMNPKFYINIFKELEIKIYLFLILLVLMFMHENRIMFEIEIKKINLNISVTFCQKTFFQRAFFHKSF